LSLNHAPLGAVVRVLPLLALACPAVLAAPYPLPPAPKFDTVPQLDAALEELRKMSWTLHSAAFAQPDSRGRSAAQDVNQWLLTPEHEARLEALRVRAQAQSGANDRAALEATLSEAATRVQQERYLVAVLGGYWHYEDVLARHKASLLGLEERLPQDDAAARQRRLAPLVTQCTGALSAAMKADSFTAEQAAVEQLSRATLDVVRSYNQERGQLAALVSNQDRLQGKAPLARARETPCEAPSTKTSGSEHPTLAAGNAAPEEVYPPTSKSNWFEGRAVIEAWVSQSGCMEKAAVVLSSGVAELDDAAIRWTQQAHFLPAEHDHKAVDGTMNFAVKFQLDDRATSQWWSP